MPVTTPRPSASDSPFQRWGTGSRIYGYMNVEWGDSPVYDPAQGIQQEIQQRDVRLNLQRLEEVCARLRTQGRNVITDGVYIYDLSHGIPRVLDVDGQEVRDMMRDLDQKQPEQQRQAVLDMPQIRYELLDTLLYLLNDEPKVMERELISYQPTLGDEHFEHNYQRQRASNFKMADIYYKSKRLCRIQRCPHQTATVYQQTQPKLRLVQRTLERLFYDQLPKVKVVVV